MAGINRIVTVLDPTTRREVRMPISECASSHMARRTFCGNLYKRVKDPNIVASMSGHKEGSKAFPDTVRLTRILSVMPLRSLKRYDLFGFIVRFVEN